MSAYHTPASSEQSPTERNEGAPPRPRPSDSRRRDKPQLSCNYCRRRKSRCDRQHPCSTCQARGVTCTYVENRLGPIRSASSEAHSVSLPDRLANLERLVMRLRPSSSNWPESTGYLDSVQPDDGTTPVVSDRAVDQISECGSMRVSESEFSYVGGDHWAAMMDSIADLREQVDREQQLRLCDSSDMIAGGNDYRDGEPISGHALLLYGCPPAKSRAEILAALPPKEAADRYILLYFERVDLVSSTIHRSTFLKEYAQFWNDPHGVSTIWLGLFFATMCLSLLSSADTDSAPAYEVEQRRFQIKTYREKTAQCLQMGQYTNGGPCVLEAMIHYIYIEFGISPDAHKDVGLLLALEVKLAMRMGYHRDPSHFPDISPLHGEMRRRVWASVLLGDVLISSQMGMPRMVSDEQWDTREPRNLDDGDLGEEVGELPLSKPETEVTTALGAIARWRVTVVLGEIADLAASVKPVDYTLVMRLDKKLHEAETHIPPPLRAKDMADSLADSPQLIMSRMFISHLIQKGQIMLHRRFLFATHPSATDTMFAYSRKACVDSSLAALQMQQALQKETQRGGRLHALRWRVTSSMNHQFLTGTMVLCSLLHRGKAPDRRGEIVEALRRARDIWVRRSCVSGEARKAARAVSVVLSGMGEGDDGCWREGGKFGTVSDAAALDNGDFDLGAEHGTLQSTGDLLGPLNLIAEDGYNAGSGLGLGDDMGDLDLQEWMAVGGPGWMGCRDRL